MAKKKRRGPPKEETAPARPDRRPAPPLAAEAEPAPEAGVPLPSWRWHAGVFLGCLAAAAFILWGAYIPLMRYHSRKHMALGDEIFAWAKRFDEEPGRAESFGPRFDAINAFLAPMARTARELWAWYQENQAKELPPDVIRDRDRPIRDAFAKYVAEWDSYGATIERIAEQTGFREDLSHLWQEVEEKHRRGRGYFEVLAAQESFHWKRTIHYYPTFEKVMEDYLPTIIRFRNCFDREFALDEAMSEYLDAVTYGRRWAPPRMKLADLYAYREWRDMAGEEYAKVVRIDPRGRYGDEAIEKLRALAAADVEVNFHLGVALLARGENEAAAAAFQEVVDGAPAGLYGPKAEECVSLARSGDRRRIEDFVADQLFL